MKKNNHIDSSIEESTFEASSEANLIVENMKKNNHIAFSIEKHDFVENELVDDDFLDVNDFEQMKAKKDFREIKKKKSLMMKTQKKIVKSIRRDSSRFEHVKQRLQITRHQQDDVTQRSELEQERQSQREQREQRDRERENKEREEDQREKRQELHAFEEKKTQHQDVYTETRRRDRDETRERKIRDEKQKVRRERTSSNSINVFFFEITSIEISKLNENLNMTIE